LIGPSFIIFMDQFWIRKNLYSQYVNISSDILAYYAYDPLKFGIIGEKAINTMLSISAIFVQSVKLKFLS